MGHYIISSATLENIQIALEHGEWGISTNRSGTPINIGDTIELRTVKSENNDNGERHIATLLVTSEPIKNLNPGFEWPDGSYPLRFGFSVVQITPDGLQKEVDEALLQTMKGAGLKGNFLWIGIQNIGHANWALFTRAKRNIIKGV